MNASSITGTRVLPDWLDAHLKVTSETEPPELFRLWCGISTVAAALQRKVWVEWGTVLYPNMYVVLVAPAGRARKGTAMQPVTRNLNSLGVPLSASATTREALIRNLSESQELLTMPTGTAYSHASLSVIAPELTSFLGFGNLSLISDLTDWFDCASKWQYRTKTQGSDDIDGVFINLLGATTPDLIRTALPPTAVGGGLTSRMIFVFEQNKGKVIPFPFLTEQDRVLQKQLMDDLHRIALIKGPYKYSQGFLSSYGDWYVASENNPPFADKSFSGYIERRPTHLIKLCMILCASRTDALVIEQEDFDRALSILERTEQKMPYTFGGVGTQKHAVTLQQIMADVARLGEVSYTTLLRNYWQDVSSTELDALVGTLAKMEFCNLAHRKDGIWLTKRETPVQKPLTNNSTGGD